MWRGPAWMTIVRDLVCLGVGVWGVIHEELSGHADLGRLAFFAVLMIAPGILATLWLAQSGTAGQSSAPPVEPSPSSPSSPPSSGTSG